MSENIPVNPMVLSWARESLGLSVEEVVHRLKRKRISAETVQAWESGDESPTYPQLERLAYEIYKRPVAVFFFPEPPEEETPKQSFRTLPEYEIENLPSRIRFLIRKAKAFQLNLAELHDGVNPNSKQIIRDLSFKPTVSAKKMAETVRSYLGVELFTQTGWKTRQDALEAWRNVLEESGVFVFKDSFQADNFSGFCLYDDKFPIIYVNNNKPKTRQIFTLFHELAHLLFHTGGIDTPSTKYVDRLKGDERKIEILCNSFAGEFLLPDVEFLKQISNMKIDEPLIKRLADAYHVSREVVLRKALDHNRVNQTYYSKMIQKWAKESISRGKGGDYYKTMASYLGRQYLETTFGRYYQNRISAEQLADYLGVKAKSVSGIEAILAPKKVTKRKGKATKRKGKATKRKGKATKRKKRGAKREVAVA